MHVCMGIQRREWLPCVRFSCMQIICVLPQSYFTVKCWPNLLHCLQMGLVYELACNSMHKELENNSTCGRAQSFEDS